MSALDLPFLAHSHMQKNKEPILPLEVLPKLAHCD